jgi:hypothetical protein
MIKKIFRTYVFASLFLFVNCDNEPYEGDIIIEDNSCELAIQASNEAADNYLNANSENFNLFCQAYKDALENQIEKCGDSDGDLQLIIDGLSDCVFNNTLCEEAIAATQQAQVNYQGATDSNFEDLCNEYKSAVQNQIDICGNSSALQSILEELGSCEPVFVDTVGTWRLVSWLNDVPLDINNDGVVTNDYLEEIDCYNNETITFNPNGTGTFFYRSIANFTFTTVMGSTADIDFNVTCNDINIDQTFTWTQSGNTIEITMTDGTILNHFRNGNSLFVVIQDGFLATNTEDSADVFSESVTYVYVRL